MTMDDMTEDQRPTVALYNDLNVINNFNKEQLIKYLEENLGDEWDTRIDLSDQQVEEYKRLLVEALSKGGDFDTSSKPEEDKEETGSNDIVQTKWSHSGNENSKSQDDTKMTTLKEQKEFRKEDSVNKMSGMHNSESGRKLLVINSSNVGNPEKEIPVITIDDDSDDGTRASRREQRSSSRSSPRRSRHRRKFASPFLVLRHSRPKSRSRSASKSFSSSSRIEDFVLQDKVDAFLAKISERKTFPSRNSVQSNSDVWFIGPATKLESTIMFQQKLKLQADGKWTEDLNKRWQQMEHDEDEVKRIFVEVRELMMDKLQKHQIYNSEWSKFWERRYKELVLNEGKSVAYADSYDYTKEWEIQWGIVARGILQRKYHQKILATRTKYGMDLSSLTTLSAEPKDTNDDTTTTPQISPTGVPTAGHGRFMYSFSPVPPPPPISSENLTAPYL